MSVKTGLFIILICSMLILTGCWDSYEIKDDVIVSFTGVDTKNNNIEIYTESVTQKNEDSKNQKVFSKMIVGEGKTAVQARNSYMRKYEANPFFGAVRATVYSDAFATGGILEDLDRLRSLTQYSKTIKLFTTTAEMKKLFDSKALNIENIGLNVSKLAEQLEKNGIFYSAILKNALEDSLVPNTGYLIGNLDIVENQIQITGYSVFNNSKKIGSIKDMAIKGVNNLISKNAQGAYTLNFEEATISFSALLKNRKIRVVYRDGQIVYHISLDIVAPIVDIDNKDVIDNKKMEKLSSALSNVIKKDVEDTLKVSQEVYGSDYLYMYKYFRAKYNSQFEKMNWNAEYKKAKFNVEVNAKAVPANGISFK